MHNTKQSGCIQTGPVAGSICNCHGDAAFPEMPNRRESLIVATSANLVCGTPNREAGCIGRSYETHKDH